VVHVEPEELGVLDVHGLLEVEEEDGIVGGDPTLLVSSGDDDPLEGHGGLEGGGGLATPGRAVQLH
jgi:hypothetical protein